MLNLNFLIEPFINLILRLTFALLIVLLGRWLERASRRWLMPALEKTRLTPSLAALFSTLWYYSIWIVTIIAALAFLGFPVEVLVALAGIIVVVVGFTLQESLRDFAAYVIFILFKPFEPGDLIETRGVTGTVKEIQFFYTSLVQANHCLVHMPNAEIQQSGINNYSKSEVLRLDLVFGVAYHTDLSRAKAILEDLVAADPRVLRDPAPQVLVLSLNESSVDLGLRPFVLLADYGAVEADLRERVKQAFDEAGIEIPFPQRDIHLFPVNETGTASAANLPPSTAAAD